MNALSTIARRLQEFAAIRILLPRLGRWHISGAVSLLAALAAPVHASTLNVPSQYATISAAMSAAANGDTILVADGTYAAQNIFITKSITIKSVNGAATTTINCSSNDFAFVSSGCTIQGFTFENSRSDPGVILVDVGCTISQCVFKNNTNFGGNGAALDLNGGTTTITGCTFDHNNGSGAISSSGGSATITNCAFTNGNAQSGGGGGAINLNTGTVTISGCTFSNNTGGSQAGGVFYWRNGTLTVTDSTFSNNSASYGGVILEGAQGINSPTTFTRCVFTGNSASTAGGVAALEAGSSGTTSFNAIDCLFIGNSASSDGGVVDGNTAGSSANRVNVTNCSFYGNTVTGGTTTGTISGGSTTTTKIVNSILYGDTAPREISTANPSATTTVQFSDIHGGGFAGSNGNINANPLYLAPASGDLHIPSVSPAAYAGTATGAPAADYDSAAWSSSISMGAFEPTITPTQFVIAAPSTATAGTAINFTVTAEDAAGNIASGYTGAVHFTTTDRYGIVPADTAITGGTGTFNATLGTVGTQTITATDSANSLTGTSSGIVVAHGPAALFGMRTHGPYTIGTPFVFNVLALDTYGNLATDYAGTVHFSSGDPRASLPADATLTGGQGSFSTALLTSGSQTVTATDTVTTSITNTLTVNMVNNPTVFLRVNASPPTSVAGASTTIVVSAIDTTGTRAYGYNGTVRLTTADPNAVLPASATVVNGIGIFQVTFKTAGRYTVTVTDTTTSSLTGTSGTVTVSPGAATHLKATAQASAAANRPFGVVVQALDAYGNVATGYTGTVHLSSTDPSATLPADGVLYSGQRTFLATLKTLGSQTVTATDTTTSSLTATTGTVTITAH